MSIFNFCKSHKSNISCMPCCSCKPCKYAVRVELERLRREHIHAENELRTYGTKIGYWSSTVEHTPEEKQEYIRLYNISKDKETAYEDYKRFADSIYRQG